MSKSEQAEVAPSADQEQATGKELEYGSPEEEFLAKRLGATNENPIGEEESDVSAEESPPGTEEEESPEEIEQEDPFAEADLTEEQREEIENNPDGGFAKRIKQLVGRTKDAEKERDELKRQLSAKTQEQIDPLAVKETGPNPFADISTIEDAQKKATELDEFIEWAEVTLDDNEDELLDSVIFTEGEKDYTKKEIRQRLRQLRKERKTHLPNQLKEIQQVENRKHEKVFFENKTKEELPWMEDEESAQSL
jgi:hypothetical protein